MNRLFRALMFLVIIGGVIVGGASELIKNELTRSVDPENEEPVVFSVEAGQTVSEIADNLQDQELIRQPLLFRLMVSQQNVAQNLQAGTYQLSQSMTMGQIINALQQAEPVEEKTITIIPGMRLEQVAEVLVEAEVVSDTETFLTVARDAQPFKERHALLESIPEGQGLEGYLFPDTYRIAATATVTDVIDRILTDGFEPVVREFETSILAEGPNGPPTIHEIVTMASIVQREAANDEEMPHLAFIFWNRLKPENADEVNGRLQADPTLQYVLGSPDDWWPKLDQLTQEELNQDVEYNTRVRQGLPPGPIAAPGRMALRSAARPGPNRPDGSPGESDLYFVAKCGENAHEFAATLAEFNQLPGADGDCSN